MSLWALPFKKVFSFTKDSVQYLIDCMEMYTLALDETQ